MGTLRQQKSYLIIVKFNLSVGSDGQISSNKSVNNSAAPLSEDFGYTLWSSFTCVAVRLGGCKPGYKKGKTVIMDGQYYARGTPYYIPDSR